jgi:signal transduction histidine kinase
MLNDLEIYADPQLERVFFILADNIVSHGKNATRLTIRYQETAAHLILIFEDNGIGIPDPLKEKIFQRSTSSKNVLGLSFAREILEITGITITETGTFGTGTRLEISVPRGSYRFPGKRE